MTPWTVARPTRLLCPWDFLGKNTRVGCHFLLQGIFPTQRSNPRLFCLLRWGAGSLPQSHQGSPTVTLTEKSLSIKWLMNWTAGGSNASCRDRQLKWRLPLLWQSSSGGTGLVKHLISFIISILIKRQPSREGREQGGFAVRDRGRTPGLPMAWLLAMEWNV